jgi:hypothetical protein
MDAQRARKNSKAFAGPLYPDAAKVSVADGTGEKSRGKGMFEAGFPARTGQKGPGFEAKNRDFQGVLFTDKYMVFSSHIVDSV